MMKVIKRGLVGYRPEIPEWDEPVIRNFNGKEVIGRHTKAYGTKSFKYAGKLYEPEPWSTSMSVLKMATQLLLYKELGKIIRFNFCLCGLYEDGSVSIPHHSDTVPTEDDLVVGVSFGAPRFMEWNQYDIYIKEHTNTSEIDNELSWSLQKKYFLDDGDVYVFDGHSQMNSTHAIPPMDNVGERISLTFRTGL
jgi:alkylated DNA repair dioxygenase AlkB